MVEKYGPFDGIYLGSDDDGNPMYDREYFSEEVASVLDGFYKTGVYPNPSGNLRVFSKQGMSIGVRAGKAIIKGRTYSLSDTKELTVKDSLGLQDRIDRVVLRLDLNERLIRLNIIEGTPSTNAKAPKLLRNDSIYDIGLAEISVKRNTTNITEANIKDTRHISEICGLMGHKIDDFDGAEIYKRYEAMLIETTQALVESLGSNEVDLLLKEIMKKQNKSIEDEIYKGNFYEIVMREGRPYARVVKINE